MEPGECDGLRQAKAACNKEFAKLRKAKESCDAIKEKSKALSETIKVKEKEAEIEVPVV